MGIQKVKISFKVLKLGKAVKEFGVLSVQNGRLNCGNCFHPSIPSIRRTPKSTKYGVVIIQRNTRKAVVSRGGAEDAEKN